MGAVEQNWELLMKWEFSQYSTAYEIIICVDIFAHIKTSILDYTAAF